jgi:hypothetical protein
MATEIDRYEATRTGWLFFAGILLVLHGTVDVVNGIYAIDRGDRVIDAAVFDSMRTWGWIHLVVGVAIAAIGICIILGQRWSIMVGIVLASIGFIVNVFWLFSYPLHAIVSLVLTSLALYGLVMYGPDAEETVLIVEEEVVVED